MKRVTLGVVALTVWFAVLPAVAAGFTVLRPANEAVQNAYGLWYGPAKSCGREGCHDDFASRPTVHSEMVTDISTSPSKLIPSAGSGKWPAPAGGGLSIGPGNVFLQLGDSRGLLQYVGFAGAATTNPTDDLPGWSPVEWEFGHGGWLQPKTPVAFRSYSQSCSPCHNTGVTRPSNASYSLQNGGTQGPTTPSGVVDFSIGCQVCHGTGEKASMHAKDVPAVIGGNAVLEAQVCGQCHVTGTTAEKGVTGAAFGNPNGYTPDEDLSEYLTVNTKVPTEEQFSAFLASGGAKPAFLPNGANYSLRHSYYNEWLLNKASNGYGHAAPTNGSVVNRNDPKCLRCHSGTGFLNRIGAKTPSGQPLVPQAPTVAQVLAEDPGISCQVCHSGHVGYGSKGEYEHERRWGDGRAVGCGDCHNWQFEVLEQATQSEIVGGKTLSRPAKDNRVRHPQREMLAGGSSAGMWGVGPMGTAMGDTSCNDCHMPRTAKEGMPADDHGDEEATRVSHRFHVVEPGDAERWRLRPNGDSCVRGCHTGAVAEYDRAGFQAWIDREQAEVEAATIIAIDALDAVAADLGLPSWLSFMSARPVSGPATDLTAGEWAMLQRAAQNVDFVVNDASHGIHNPSYAKAGLAKAEQWAESLGADVSLSWQGGSVDGDTAMLTVGLLGRSGSIPHADVTLQASIDGGLTWTDRRKTTASGSEFQVLAAPVVGSVVYRVVYSPTDGVRYASDPVTLEVPVTSASVSPVQATTGWAAGSATVSLSGNEGVTFYSLSGAVTRPATIYTGPIGITADGSTTIRYWSTSASGREATRSMPVRVDGRAPSIGASVKSSYAEKAAIVLTASDSASGVKSIRYVLDGSAPVVVSGSSATLDVTKLGSHSLKVSACDGVGRWSAAAYRTFRVKSRPVVAASPSRSRYTVRKGSTWVLSATVKRPNGKRISGKRILLQRSRDGRSWKTYAKLETNSRGVAKRALPTHSAGTYYWRWRVTSSTKYYSATGPKTRVRVR